MLYTLIKHGFLTNQSARMVVFIANEAADPRGSAVELANHRAVREYRRKISSQRKGLFLTIFGCK